ncbi:MAG TPA: hypothetical protein VFN90_07500, partial [Gemmatimonadales bacterium]|nr:hypothetical protein [Gemmatimonadales bacterium]
KVMHATPVRTLEAIGRLFPAHPWNLIFDDTVGGHPLDGGVLTFAVREMTAGDYVGTSAVSTLRYYLTVIDAYQLRVRLHPLANDPRRCEVTITVDLRAGVAKNAKYGMLFGGGFGAVSAAVSIAISAAKGAALVAAPIGLGALAIIGGLMVGAYRWSFRWGLGKARKELEHLLDSVQASVRSQDVFGAPPPVPLPPPAANDDASWMIGLGG